MESVEVPTTHDIDWLPVCRKRLREFGNSLVRSSCVQSKNLEAFVWHDPDWAIVRRYSPIVSKTPTGILKFSLSAAVVCSRKTWRLLRLTMLIGLKFGSTLLIKVRFRVRVTFGQSIPCDWVAAHLSFPHQRVENA